MRVYIISVPGFARIGTTLSLRLFRSNTVAKLVQKKRRIRDYFLVTFALVLQAKSCTLEIF